MNNKENINKILIGKIISVFGIKGEVKILAYTQEPFEISKFNLTDNDGNSLKIEISKNNYKIDKFSNYVITTKLLGVNDRNEALKQVGKEIYILKSELKSNKDEFFIIDLVGIEVRDKNSNKIGVISNIFDFKAGTLVEIEFTDKKLFEQLANIDIYNFTDENFPEVNLIENYAIFNPPAIVK